MSHPRIDFPAGGGPAVSDRVRRIVLGIVAALVFLIIGVPWLASFATDWLWFREIQFQSVFLTSLVARALLFAAVGTVAFTFLYVNLRWARRGPTSVPAVFVGRDGTQVDFTSAV